MVYGNKIAKQARFPLSGHGLPQGQLNEHLQLPAFAKQQCPVPLLLGHQVVHQPDLCQTGQILEPIKLCNLSDPVGAEVQELKASQAGQVSQAPQPVVTKVQATKSWHAREAAWVEAFENVVVQDELSQTVQRLKTVNTSELVAVQVYAPKA